MTVVPQEFEGHVELVNATPNEVVELAQARGFKNLYIDGGKTIQQFLRADLIDELIVSEIPVLLGGGDRLFAELDQRMDFELVGTEVLLGQIARKHYRRKRG